MAIVLGSNPPLISYGVKLSDGSYERAIDGILTRWPNQPVANLTIAFTVSDNGNTVTYQPGHPSAAP